MKIIVYPIGENPYQNLLFNELKKHKKVEINYLRNEFIDTKNAYKIGMFIFPFRLLYHKIKGWKVIHLHWLSPFVLPVNNKYLKYLSSFYILSFLVVIKLLRFKLVWTLHEILPHDNEFHDDLFIRRVTSRFSDIQIFHSPAALNEAKQLKFNINNSYIIPHGNYHAAYPNTTSKEQARAKFNFQKNDFVFLFFGMIKPYKGIDKLLESFEKILGENKRAHILIAGQVVDQQLANTLKAYKKKYKSNIKLYLHHIKNSEVQYFFNAADVVVLPFKKNTTSGTAVLSLSFGKPIIAPLLGNIIDLPKKTVILYNPQDKNGLTTSMKKAISNKTILQKMGHSAKEYSKTLLWDKIALQTKKTFDKLFIVTISSTSLF